MAANTPISLLSVNLFGVHCSNPATLQASDSLRAICEQRQRTSKRIMTLGHGPGRRATGMTTVEQPWIRSFALLPRRLTDGGVVWLRPYEWRWRRILNGAPSAVTPPTLETRRVSEPSRHAKLATQ